MNRWDTRLKKGIVVQTSYGIGTVHGWRQVGGDEVMVELEFWRDITQGDRTFAGSSWPIERCEYIAENDQELIDILMEEV